MRKAIIVMKSGYTFVLSNFNETDVSEINSHRKEDHVVSVLDISNPNKILYLDPANGWEHLAGALFDKNKEKFDGVMTVKKLSETTDLLKKSGCSNNIVEAWDSNSNVWMPVTSLTYSPDTDETIKLYIDDYE